MWTNRSGVVLQDPVSLCICWSRPYTLPKQNQNFQLTWVERSTQRVKARPDWDTIAGDFVARLCIEIIRAKWKTDDKWFLFWFLLFLSLGRLVSRRFIRTPVQFQCRVGQLNCRWLSGCRLKHFLFRLLWICSAK